MPWPTCSRLGASLVASETRAGRLEAQVGDQRLALGRERIAVACLEARLAAVGEGTPRVSAVSAHMDDKEINDVE